MSSTTANKKKKRTIRFWAVAVWLFVWQAVSVWIGQEILLVSPVVVLERLTGRREFGNRRTGFKGERNADVGRRMGSLSVSYKKADKI